MTFSNILILLDEVNSDWKIPSEGKEKFGNKFKITKNIISKNELKKEEKITI